MNEFQRRKGAAENNQIGGKSYGQQQAGPPPPNTANPDPFQTENTPMSPVKGQGQSRHGPLHAVWHRGLLLLVRRTLVEGKESIQGCLLNWPEIRRRLRLDITDLLPKAKLIPIANAPAANRTLVVGDASGAAFAGSGTARKSIPSVTPIRLSLLIAWGGVFLAATAVAVLLMCVVRLSERRGAFVSAVTHELRTPLTTFRLYTEMLADGIVPTEAKTPIVPANAPRGSRPLGASRGECACLTPGSKTGVQNWSRMKSTWGNSWADWKTRSANGPIAAG